MPDTTFNLLDEPWVAVRGPDGLEEVSLREAFRRAHELDALAGEIPTQDAAVLRLMIAVLHRVADHAPGSRKETWTDWWEAKSLPMGVIGGYLERWRHRFDLLHQEHPFMQVGGLRAAKTSGLKKLVADVPDGHQFFTTRAGRALDSMSYAEAARWLVHAQAYDVSGIKTGAVGDDRVKGGKSYPIGTGWGGRCGLVIIEHQSLKDALLLNLVLRPRDSDAEPDSPVWERAPLTSAIEIGHADPLGPADLMTWPIRRILLHHNGSRVTDVLISNGDPISPQNRQRVETMTAFRRSPNQESKLPPPVYMPQAHDPSRVMWRGLASILAPRTKGGAVGNDAPVRRPPENLDWHAELTSDERITPDLLVRVRAIGMSFGPQDATVTATFDDSLTLHLAAATDERLKAEALAAASAADDAVQCLAQLAANIARAAGREADGPREEARESAFARLDEPYRRWLNQLTLSTDVDEARAGWHTTVNHVLLRTADEVIGAGGEIAWKGRQVMGRHVDSSIAQAWFLAGLRKALPRAWANDKEEAS